VAKAGKRSREAPNGQWKLVVYLAGDTPVGLSAMENLRRICREHLDGRVRIKVVDLLQNPEAARVEQIVVVPTVVRKNPRPEKRVFGNLMATDQVMRVLEIPADHSRASRLETSATMSPRSSSAA